MMAVTSEQIWGTYLSCSWQGPILVGALGMISAGLENGPSFLLLGFLGAGLYGLLFSYIVALVIGVPLLFLLKSTNFLSSNAVIAAGSGTGLVFAAWFALSSTAPIVYPLSCLICGFCSGWFGRRHLFST